MKASVLRFLSGCMLLVSLFFAACSENKCQTTICAYNGQCNEDDGSCTCLPGYEGSRCETVSRNKFLGSWRVTEKGSRSNTAEYATSIEEGTEINKVIIRNIYGKPNSIIEGRISRDTVYIPQQIIQVGEDLKTIEGKGFIAGHDYYNLQGQLIMSYKVTSEDTSVDEFGVAPKGSTFSIWIK